jgi:dTDP-4-dehydrorhamnose reductase
MAARRPLSKDVIAFDALTDDVTSLLQRITPLPKAVVVAFGISGTHTCASDPVGSRRLNVDRVLAVAQGISKLGSLPVLLSTDCVFDGSSVVWSEEHKPNPICEYGRQRFEVEQAVAKLGVPYLTIRLSRVIADHARRKDILYQWCDQVRQGESVQLATDQVFTPIAAGDLGPIVVALIDAGARGLINVAGPEQISSPDLFDMFQGACEKLGVKLKFKRELCLVSDLPGLELRPASTMLSIKRLGRFISAGFTPLVESVESVAAAAFFPDEEFELSQPFERAGPSNY